MVLLYSGFWCGTGFCVLLYFARGLYLRVDLLVGCWVVICNLIDLLFGWDFVVRLDLLVGMFGLGFGLGSLLC